MGPGTGASQTLSPQNSPNSSPTQEILSPYSPKISVLSPRKTSYTAVGDLYAAVPLTFETNASLSWVGYSLDGGENVTGVNGTLVEIPVGSRSLTVYANDTTGNWAEPNTVYYSVEWTDFPPPFPWLLGAAVSATVAAVVASTAVVYLKKRKHEAEL